MLKSMIERIGKMLSKEQLINLVVEQIRKDLEADESLGFTGLEYLLEHVPDEHLKGYLPSMGDVSNA